MRKIILGALCVCFTVAIKFGNHPIPTVGKVSASLKATPRDLESLERHCALNLAQLECGSASSSLVGSEYPDFAQFEADSGITMATATNHLISSPLALEAINES